LVQKKLLHVCSDHAPILLSRGGLQNGITLLSSKTCGLKGRAL
jgi:hypothetical protein